ncbi:hypothetical protein WJX74_005288 [Apatococcus lobatus]|uniref:DUF819 family protein n=2 Tax=Apatococcus TaxID=904362 RepID=A0AAW1T9W3_9CHLO
MTCAGIGKVVQDRTPLGQYVSALIITLLLTLTLASLGVLPVQSAAYDTIWQQLMPLGAALYLLESDLSRLKDVASPSLAGFGIGAVGTIAGTLVAWRFFGSQMGPDGYKLASALAASYVGGSVNFAAVSQSLNLAGPSMAAAMAADNVAMAAYLAAIGLIPANGPNDSNPLPLAAPAHSAAEAPLNQAGSVELPLAHAASAAA